MHKRLKWTIYFLSLVLGLRYASAKTKGQEQKESTENAASKIEEDLSRIKRSPSGNVFLGMRGKKEALPEDCNDNSDVDGLMLDSRHDAFRDQEETVDNPPSGRFLLHARPFFGLKRANNFMAMRGKKDPFDATEMRKTQRLDSDLKSFFEDKRGQNIGFTGMRGKKNSNVVERRRRPEVKFQFLPMRGRRSKRRVGKDARDLCPSKRTTHTANMEQTQQNKEEGSESTM